MSFIEFCIRKGYKPFRKIYDKGKGMWIYTEEYNLFNYFSSTVSGYLDIRLIKNDNEIVFGIPYLYNGKTHFPTLIYPNLFKNMDEAFEKLSFREILECIEDWFRRRKDEMIEENKQEQNGK